ncbi:MAG: PDZ domain-containing protein [Acidobacteriota bacterium]
MSRATTPAEDVLRSLLLILCFSSLAAPLNAQTQFDEITAPTGWLGLGITCERDAENQESFLLIHGTAPSGPASKTDLEAGDIILSIDGADASCQTQLDALQLFRDLKAAQRVRLSILRSGQQRTVDLQAVEMPDHLAAMWVRQYRRLRERGEDNASQP